MSKNKDHLANSIYQLMPPLSESEYTDLLNDIRDRGVQVPIEMDEAGNILDGHHRLRACNELGIRDYPTIIRVGLNEAQKRAHVRALNLNRRHLSQKERRDLIAEQVKETPRMSNRQIAKKLGVDHKTVATVRTKLTNRGEIPHIERLQDSLGRLQAAKRPAIIATGKSQAQKIISLIAENNQLELPGKMIEAKRFERIAREQRGKSYMPDKDRESIRLNDSIEIRCGDFRETLADLDKGSVDLVLTDPPYPKEFLSLWDDLGAMCAEILRPGGCLVTYSGQQYLPHIYSSLGKHLEYVWTIAQFGSGQKTLVHAVRFYSRWKPILVFCKPPFQRTQWIDDVCGGSGPEKDHHRWQQSEEEARFLIKAFSKQREMVVDPFMGGGTNAVVSLAEGRKFIGCDIEETAVAKTMKRLKEKM